MIKITYNVKQDELDVEINYQKLQRLTIEQADYIEKKVLPMIVQAINKAQILKQNKVKNENK